MLEDLDKNDVDFVQELTLGTEQGVVTADVDDDVGDVVADALPLILRKTSPRRLDRRVEDLETEELGVVGRALLEDLVHACPRFGVLGEGAENLVRDALRGGTRGGGRGWRGLGEGERVWGGERGGAGGRGREKKRPRDRDTEVWEYGNIMA